MLKFKWKIPKFDGKQLDYHSEEFTGAQSSFRWKLRLTMHPDYRHQPFELTTYIVPESLGNLDKVAVTVRARFVNHRFRNLDFDKTVSATLTAGRNSLVVPPWFNTPPKFTHRAGWISKSDDALVIKVKIHNQARLQSPQAIRLENISAHIQSMSHAPDKTFADLTLIAGTRNFRVHRAILVTRCEYFKTMLNSGLSEANEKEITLADVDPDALGLTLRFIYGFDFEQAQQQEQVSREAIRRAVSLADRFLLSGLSMELQTYIVDTCTGENVIEDIQWAATAALDADRATALMEQLQGIYICNSAAVDKTKIEKLSMEMPTVLAKLHEVLVQRARAALPNAAY